MVLIIEKSLALIVVSHMHNVPPLCPIAVEKPSRQPQPIELSEWQKFHLIRTCLKHGERDYGLSKTTVSVAQKLFTANLCCLVMAVLLGLYGLLKTII